MLMKSTTGISQWPDEKEIYEKMDRCGAVEPLHPIKPEAMQRYLRYFDEKCQGSHAMIQEAKRRSSPAACSTTWPSTTLSPW